MAMALEGVRMIEVAQLAAAPGAGALLADWGAEVIKVEHPMRGDAMRSFGGGVNLPISGVHPFFEPDNRNKKSLAVDLSKKEGQEIIHKLVKTADVLYTNMRPHELERYKLEYETLSQLNPRLIFASLSGYGRKGPEKETPGYDWTAYWARAGIMSTILPPESTPPFARIGLGDHPTSIALACGIMTALFVRERTGIGQEVDVALLATGIWALQSDIQMALLTGMDFPQRPVEERPAMTNTYQTNDGRWILLVHTHPVPYWSPFCQAIGHPELEQDERFSTLEARLQNRAILVAIAQEAFASWTLAECAERLDRFGVIWGPVQTPTEVVKDPQARAIGCFATLDHPTHGRVELVANPIKLSKTPDSIRTPAPEIGQHTEDILLELGYTWDEIARLKEDTVIP